MSQHSKNGSEIRIHPAGWESSSDTERYPISPMGHIMAKAYVLITEVFALPEDSDINTIVKNMTLGLEFSLPMFPALVGVLELDEKSGRMWVTKNRDSTVGLHVNHLVHDEGFPSYEELEKKDFPASLISCSKVLPESVTERQLNSPAGDNNQGGLVAAVFQVNFIRGGLILGVAVHHCLLDGPGCDGFLTAWAENSASAGKGITLVASKPAGFELVPNINVPTAEQFLELETQFPVVKDAGGPMKPPPVDFTMPRVASYMWHFPKSKAKDLKSKASVGLGDGWISTYDAILAFIWSRVTLARLELLQLDLDSEAILVHAVDTRKMWDPPTPDRSLGVGVTPARCGPFTIREIINTASLSKLAGSVRASIKELTPQHLTGLLQWVVGHQDQRWLGVKMSSFLGPDLGASSWQGMATYEKHDFGFGLPKALRRPNPPFDGSIYLYPTRENLKSSTLDEGIEVCISLEEGCQMRLVKDEVMLSYAQPRGI